MRSGKRFLVGGVILLLVGCASAGRNFNVTGVSQLSIGQTAKSDVMALFGSPWRTGIEDGRETWTYGHYKYSLFSDAKTRDLVLRFDPSGKVVSYTFNSSYPQDRRP
jgi:outer membrane protein assembly factor BamE (lipoprotein component of BamABCDE complex)